MSKSRHFLLRTDDLRWAVCMAGALFKAEEGHRLTLETDAEELEFMAEHLSPPSSDMEEIHLPETPEEYRALDVLTAKKTQIEIDLIMGMVIDQEVEVREIPIDSLCASILFRDHEIVTKPGYYFPKPTRKVLEAYSREGVNIALADEKYQPQTLAFWQGIGGTAKMIQFSSLPMSEQIRWLAAMSNPRSVFATDVENPIMYVLRAWYKDYQSLNKTPVILSFVPPDRSGLDARTTLIWPQNVPTVEGASEEEMFRKGKWWLEQIEAGFDPTEFHKRRAGKGAGQ